jgi:hypothetical protein
MKITDLEKSEKIVFGCLVRIMVRSDGKFTEEEEEQVNRIGVEELGDAQDMWHLISISAAAHVDENEIRSEVMSVTRPEARALILRVLKRIASADSLDTTEVELLDWLRNQWK